MLRSSRQVGVRSASLLAVLVVLAVLVASNASTRDGDVLNMTPLDRLFTGLPNATVYSDPYLYVGLDSGVECYDASDLLNIQFVGEVYLPSPAFDLKLVGDDLYVANGESGLQIVDTADPANLVVVGSLSLPPLSGAVARGIDVVGNQAYLAETAAFGSVDFGLRVVDITSSTTPFELGYQSIDNGALTVTIAGSVAYVGLGSSLDGRHGMALFDVSNPALPVEIVAGFRSTGLPINQIALDGSVAYAAAGNGLAGALVSFDLSNPVSPTILDYEPVKNGVLGLSVSSGRVRIASRESGLAVYDSTDPANLTRLAALPLDELAVAVVDGPVSVAFVGLRSSNGAGGFVAVDTISMTTLGGMSHSEATAVATGGTGFAYLLGRDGLHIFDTTTPSSPAWIAAWWQQIGDLSQLAVDGTLAAVSNGDVVHLIDVTDPATPTEAGQVMVSLGIAGRLVLDNNYLYVVTGNGLEVFDLAVLPTPSPQGTLQSAGMSSAFVVEGSIGYLVAGEELIVVDLAAPAAPAVIQTMTVAGEQLIGVDVASPLLVMTGRINRLYTVDVTDPSFPTMSGMVPGGSGVDVDIVGDRAVVSGAGDGVRVVDVSDPTNPIEEAFYDLSGTTINIATDGNYLFVASSSAQHWVVDCDTCTAQCVDTWPGITPNSLRVAKLPGRDTLSWSISSGVGSVNVHRVGTKQELLDLYLDSPSIVTTTTATDWLDPLDPGPQGIVYYRVYGSGTCTGNSFP